METNEIVGDVITEWVPEGSPLVLGMVGKLGEEASELSGICCRIVCQGLEGVQPKTGKTNRRALTDEIGDVEALCWQLKERLLDSQERADIRTRVALKRSYGKPWFDFLATLCPATWRS